MDKDKNRKNKNLQLTLDLLLLFNSFKFLKKLNKNRNFHTL